MTDFRTYPVTPVTHLRAENERLRAELDLRLRQLVDAGKAHGELLTSHETLQRQHADAMRELTENAAELGQALDLALAERDAAFAELDATNKMHAEIIKRWKEEEVMWRDFDKKQLAEIDALRAELDTMRQAHSVIAARMAGMGWWC